MSTDQPQTKEEIQEPPAVDTETATKNDDDHDDDNDSNKPVPSITLIEKGEIIETIDTTNDNSELTSENAIEKTIENNTENQIEVGSENEPENAKENENENANTNEQNSRKRSRDDNIFDDDRDINNANSAEFPSPPSKKQKLDHNNQNENNDNNNNDGPSQVLMRSQTELKKYLEGMNERTFRHDLLPKLCENNEELMNSVRDRMHNHTILCKLFIRSLSYDTKDHTVHDIFKEFGNVKEAVIVKDRTTNKSRGFGFITMSNASEAQLALDKHRKIIDGRESICNLAAKPQGQKSTNASDSNNNTTHNTHSKDGHSSHSHNHKKRGGGDQNHDTRHNNRSKSNTHSSTSHSRSHSHALPHPTHASSRVSPSHNVAMQPNMNVNATNHYYPDYANYQSSAHATYAANVAAAGGVAAYPHAYPATAAYPQMAAAAAANMNVYGHHQARANVNVTGPTNMSANLNGYHLAQHHTQHAAAAQPHNAMGAFIPNPQYPHLMTPNVALIRRHQ